MADDEVEDLDAPGPEGMRTDPDGGGPAGSGRSGRRRLGTAVVVAVLAAAAAAGATGVHQRSAATTREGRLLAQLSVQAGELSVGGSGGPQRGGRMRVGVSVPLLNRGPRTVVVTVAGLTGRNQRVIGVPVQATVPAGRSVTAALQLAVDCAAFPDPGTVTPSSAPVAVRATVAVVPDTPGAPVGPPVAVRLSAPGATSTFAEQVGQVCHPWLQGAVDASWSYSGDGRAHLHVANENPSGTKPVVLVLQQSRGLGVTSSPSMPLSVPPGSSVLIDLSVDPDCPAVADGANSQLGVLELDEDGTPSNDLALYSDSTSGSWANPQAWLVRQIAVRCR